MNTTNPTAALTATELTAYRILETRLAATIRISIRDLYPLADSAEVEKMSCRVAEQAVNKIIRHIEQA